MSNLEAARAGHLAIRRQLVNVMSNTDGTEQPDQLLGMYDEALRRLYAAELHEDAGYLRDKRAREAQIYSAKVQAFTGG